MHTCTKPYWLPDRAMDSPKDLRKEIKDAGYEIPSNTRGYELLGMIRSVDLQSPNYRKCTPDELRVFAARRKILPDEKTRKTKKQLVDALESADQGKTFSQFLNLTPELRAKSTAGSKYYNFRLDLKDSL